MPGGEYEPIADLNKSRAKLSNLGTEIVLPVKELFEGVLDVLASRGGERWKSLKSLSLATPSRYGDATLEVGYRPKFDDEEEGQETPHVFLNIKQNGNDKMYLIQKENYGPDDFEEYTLNEVYLDPDDGLTTYSDENNSDLGAARLMDFLASAHYIRQKPIPKSAYRLD